MDYSSAEKIASIYRTAIEKKASQAVLSDPSPVIRSGMMLAAAKRSRNPFKSGITRTGMREAVREGLKRSLKENPLT